MADNVENNTPNPTYSPIHSPDQGAADVVTRSRDSSSASSRLRRASLKFKESGPPLGAWHAAGEALGKAPTPNDIIKGSFSHDGWDGRIQRRHSVVSEESVRRLARTTSNQVATTLGTIPSELQPHQETEAENEPFPKYESRGEMMDQIFTRQSTIPIDDDEDLAPDADEKPSPKKPADQPMVEKPLEKSGASTKRPTTLSPTQSINQGPDVNGVYPNGYKFPPKHTRGEAAKIGFKAFCRYAVTIQGFLVVIYCLNIVAWGGMLFLLLIGGGNQYMCYPEYLHGIKDCSDLQSPRRIWIETDSQILNALFCVTGLGLIPWRFRDLYYLLKWRLLKKQSGLRRLGGIHNGWFRLPGSHKLPVSSSKVDDLDYVDNPATALPVSKTPADPLTGIRAPDTKTWKLDFVIWAMVCNTLLQIVLCVFMWGFNRFNRPSWATGTFIALACVVAGLAGIMTFVEAKRVKAIEGIPVEEEALLKDLEQGEAQKEAGDIKRRSQKGTEKKMKTERKHDYRGR